MKKVPTQLIETLKNNETFLLLAHNKPDGDAIGSVIVLGKTLKAMGKTVDYYIDTPVEEKLRFFSEISYFNEHLAAAYDVIVLLDCSTLDHTYQPKQLPDHKVLAVIDHHKSNEAYGDVNFIEITSATAELVYRIATALEIPLDEEMIDAVFTGISTDTGSFQFSNVTSETHEILSQLYRLKTNFAVLSKRLHSEKSYSQMKLYGKAVESMRLFADNTIAWILLTYEDISKYGGPLNITDDIANIGMNTIGVQLSATLKEVDNGEYRVSLRSKSPFNIDVSELAKAHGGGGHIRAAGFTYSGDLEVLKQELRALIEKQRSSENG
ncbi:MAG: bifunctional oligoribonuclease/PAP phosphatase NrnA [Eubacterium sp.]|nr:bifunctional oligoribonuclease/PAP phosphatase NrnA [Eubacterium sp.]